jgi:hypothetical protein
MYYIVLKFFKINSRTPKPATNIFIPRTECKILSRRIMTVCWSMQRGCSCQSMAYSVVYGRIAHSHPSPSAEKSGAKQRWPSRNIYVLHMKQNFYATGSQTIKPKIFYATSSGALVPARRPGRPHIDPYPTGC